MSGEAVAASAVAVPVEPAAVPASDAPVSGTREKVAGRARRARLGSMRELAEWDRGRIGYRFVKRAFDIAFSACVIAVGIVPSAVLCAAIAIDSPGCRSTARGAWAASAPTAGRASSPCGSSGAW